jgi:hypothetical protein
MKKITTVLLFLFLGSLGFSQNSPKIEFKLAENIINYGNTSKKTDNGIRTFEFTNAGDAPLIINNVFSTSEFTFPIKPTEPILPGKTGKIEIKYNMIPGPIRKTIIIESNATNYENGIIVLKVKGIVNAEN